MKKIKDDAGAKTTPIDAKLQASFARLKATLASVKRADSKRRKISKVGVVPFDPAKKKTDRPAAKSHCVHSGVEHGRDDISSFASFDEKEFLTESGEIKQEIAERWFLKRRDLDEIEYILLLLLNKGAKFEGGVHYAHLMPARDDSGANILKLVIR